MSMKKSVWTIIILSFFFSACSRNSQISMQADIEPEKNFHLSKEKIFTEKLISSMSDTELAAQVLMTGIEGNTMLNPAMKELLGNIPAGAVMLFKYNLTKDIDTIRGFLEETSLFIKSSGKNIAPFIAVDHEGGYVHRFAIAVERLPAPYTFWEDAQKIGRDKALEHIQNTAASSGKKLAALGINMNLAPVAEIETPENRIFLDSRSYGPDPEFVSASVSAFILGMYESGVLSVLKHFPGSTNADPHNEAAVLKQNREELDVMIFPFKQSIIDNNARAFMISHSIVNAVDSEKNGSLSEKVIKTWLREELGFNGIVISDDFSMKAVSSRGISMEDAVVEALSSGVNLIMVWPGDLQKTHQAILNALESGKISRNTLELSAEKIIFEKIKIGAVFLEQ